jgi:hypothetical protein
MDTCLIECIQPQVIQTHLILRLYVHPSLQQQGCYLLVTALGSKV